MTSDDRITVDCGACKGCGEADASGFPCYACGGRGFYTAKKPKRDFEKAGKAAFERGQPISANPYRYGWPAHGWTLGWVDAAESARKQGKPQEVTA